MDMTRALGSRLSALGSRLSALGSRLSALGSRLSALGSRLSALGSRLSALGSRLLLTVRPSAPASVPEPPADRGLAPGTGSGSAAVGAGPVPAANPPEAGSCRRWDPGGACNCSMGGSHFHCRPSIPWTGGRLRDTLAGTGGAGRVEVREVSPVPAPAPSPLPHKSLAIVPKLM